MAKTKRKWISRKQGRLILISLLIVFGLVFFTGCATDQNLEVPGISLSVDSVDGEPAEVSAGVQLLILMTVLSLAPSILVLATSFTRIVIVFSLVRNAVGTPTVPPNQVLVGLALILTFFIMSPTINEINEEALQPYLNEEITQAQFFENAMEPIRTFMFRQTEEKDIMLFLEINGDSQPETLEDISTTVLLPAFVLSELRTAFTMGFMIYVPFLIIDMVIASVLLAMGMMMLPPSMISLPFKLLLFVMVDGWYLLVKSLSISFF